jgi:flavin reductase (DIM6/NTAB) family NADH-FMN oxidoreductase RutF
MSPLGEFVFRSDSTMYVVTARAGDRSAGCLVGFACQVSISPERFLVAISAANHTHRVAAEADVLALHLLPSWATDLARLFGECTGDTVDKFSRCRSHEGPQGVPVLDDAIGVMIGRIADRIDFGDHTGHLLEPVSAALTASWAPPYALGQARALRPGHPVRSPAPPAP